MEKADVLIVGAGAAGLIAAYELALAGKKVILLEARDRIGGRIHTLLNGPFAQPVEMGAEFIHGRLPLTLQLLHKAGIKEYKSGGKMWRIANGRVQTSGEMEGWDEVMKKLKEVKEDLTLAEFLQTYFGDEQYKELRTSVVQYVQGYDAADVTKASTLALRNEWENEDDGHQTRIEGGYGSLLHFLAKECTRHGASILLQQAVKSIEWEKNKVTAITANGAHFFSSKILITLPLGVWQAKEETNGAVHYLPELTDKKNAAAVMGYGGVIKINIECRRKFWEKETGNKLNNAGFIFSEETIPTWWTQHPQDYPLLTGWLAGPPADAFATESNEAVLHEALFSLAQILNYPIDKIKEEVTAFSVANWVNDPYSRGAYSYATIHTEWAKKELAKPLLQTLYVAGEALYDGAETGTVEAALQNGRDTARQMIVDF